VETTNKSKKENRTANVLWTQIGEEQRKYANLRLLNEDCWPPWQQEPFHCSSLKRAWMRRLISFGD
jgi:hypothetical protein